MSHTVGGCCVAGNNDSLYRLLACGVALRIFAGIIAVAEQKLHILDNVFNEKVTFSFGIVHSIGHIGLISKIGKAFIDEIGNVVATRFTGGVIEYVKGKNCLKDSKSAGAGIENPYRNGPVVALVVRGIKPVET